MLSVIFVII